MTVKSLEAGGDEGLKFSIMKSRAGRERRERERKPANASSQFAAAWSVGPVLTVLGMVAEMGLRSGGRHGRQHRILRAVGS
jgi:hypothetical protein